MRIALDTNRYVDFAKGEPDAVDTISRASEICIPLIVLGELRAGFFAGSRSAANEQNLVRFLNSPRVRILYPDDATIFQYARIFAELKRKGTPIPTNDLWIAALVVQHDLLLFTRDSHFDRIQRLPRL